MKTYKLPARIEDGAEVLALVNIYDGGEGADLHSLEAHTEGEGCCPGCPAYCHATKGERGLVVNSWGYHPTRHPVVTVAWDRGISDVVVGSEVSAIHSTFVHP